LTNQELELLRATVSELLKRSGDPIHWSAKGIGMARLSLPNRRRLHLWHTNFMWADNALKHTHPWGLRSTIVAGVLENRRFTIGEDGKPYHVRRVDCGAGTCEQYQVEDASLVRGRREVYNPGDSYSQDPGEIHESRAMEGTVSIMSKVGDDTGQALVFYHHWADAYERTPNRIELAEAIEAALERL